jgi:hypothetical protein
MTQIGFKNWYIMIQSMSVYFSLGRVYDRLIRPHTQVFKAMQDDCGACRFDAGIWEAGDGEIVRFHPLCSRNRSWRS